jgi:RNA polymerase sigma-70 factor (ECF subfamily)
MLQSSANTGLVERLQAGDGSAVDELSARYGSRIYQLAFRYMKNREDAEEVTQDVLMKVYRKIEAFRGDAALSSWIYRITFNTAMSRLRTVRHSRPAEVSESALLPDGEGGAASRKPRDVADWSSLSDEALMRKQLKARLVGALAELPAIYRTPVLLRDIHGLSTEEASAVLRVKPQTLKSRLHRGRLVLRERLGDFAGGLALHRPS